MSFVATYVARHSLTIEDVYGRHLEDGGSYWVHEEPDECWSTEDGEWVGEAMSDAIDVDASSQVYGLRHERDAFRNLWSDPKRDRALSRLRATKERLVKIESKLRSRDYDLTKVKLKELGYEWGTDKLPEGLYEKTQVVSDDTKAAREAVEKAAAKIFEFHRKYILSRRVPIAVGIYGST